MPNTKYYYLYLQRTKADGTFQWQFPLRVDFDGLAKHPDHDKHWAKVVTAVARASALKFAHSQGDPECRPDDITLARPLNRSEDITIKGGELHDWFELGIPVYLPA